MKINVGLQIYTVRDMFDKGLDFLFGEAAALGYKGIEMISMDMPNEELKGLLDKHGLTLISTHRGAEELEKNFASNVEYCKYLGTNKITIPGLPGDWTKDYASSLATAQRLDALAIAYAAEGIELSYHNHSHEFELVYDGICVEDIFVENAPNLKFELDMGWAFAAGVDVPAYIRKLGKKLHLVHIKDVDADKKPTEVGNGCVNMKECIEAAEEVGVKWGVVEQDICVGRTPLEAIAITMETLKTF